MDGVTLNGIHCSTWGLILSTVSIEKPTPKTSYIDIPFGDGSIDISEAAGEVKYQDRKITMSLQKFVESKAELETLSAEIAGKLQGKKVKINFDSDPDYYHYGRTVIASYQKTNPLAEIIIEAQCEPYKYINDVTEKTYNCAYNLLMNGNMASTDGWTPTGGTVYLGTSYLRLVTVSGQSTSYVTHALIESLIAGHKYYIKAGIKVTNAVCASIYVELQSNQFAQTSPANGTKHIPSGVFTATDGTSSIKVGQTYSSAYTNGEMWVGDVIVVDLTKVYGAGNEPTKTEFETILANFANLWFDVAILGGDAVSDVRKTQYPPLSTAINLLLNGNMASADGWVPNYPITITAAENILTATSPSGYTEVRVTHAMIEALVAGHKYYVKAESWTAILATHSLTLGSNPAISLSGAGASAWHLLSDVITAAASEAATIMAKIQYGTTNSHVNKLKNVMIVDLTKVYGAGNEPTKSEFETILADFDDSWFDVANVPGWELPVTLTNGRKTAYLVVTTNAPFSIVKGENIYTFGAVAALQSVIPLTEGENVLNLNGNGKITLDWQEGAL